MNLKLEKLLTAGFAAALGASFLAANPADARNGWMKADCNSKGDCSYHKVTSRGYPFVEYKTNGQHFNSASMADCQQWRVKATSIRGKAYQEGWQEVMPGSIGEAEVEMVCR